MIFYCLIHWNKLITLFTGTVNLKTLFNFLHCILSRDGQYQDMIHVSAISIAQYFCIDIELVFHHSITYRYQLSVFLCITDTSISILFLSTSNLTRC